MTIAYIAMASIALGLLVVATTALVIIAAKMLT